MNEQERLQELNAYRILDTLPEQELDELAEIASAICDTPISLLSFIDDKRQWFKAKKGTDVHQTTRKDSFCQHALQNPEEILIVNDPLNDKRFRDNPFVLGDPHIRFYAGAPLQTPQGHVLGTLCIIDNKPRSLSENQKKALQLLAKKAMDYLEARRLILEQGDTIESNASRLKKLTDQAPGAIYQFEMRPDGKISFSFISKGITNLHPKLNPDLLKENSETFLSVVHPDDVELVKNSFQESFLYNAFWHIEFRLIWDNGNIIWVSADANPEKKADGAVAWHGTFRDITEKKEYIKTLEQILFDISHVMRRPVATMLGLTTAVQDYELDEKTLKEYISHIKTVSEEMDDYLRKLNEAYHELRIKVTSLNNG